MEVKKKERMEKMQITRRRSLLLMLMPMI